MRWRGAYDDDGLGRTAVEAVRSAEPDTPHARDRRWRPRRRRVEIVRRREGRRSVRSRGNARGSGCDRGDSRGARVNRRKLAYWCEAVSTGKVARRSYPPLPRELQTFAESQLDWEVERALGYDDLDAEDLTCF